jgi:peroxiredoxin
VPKSLLRPPRLSTPLATALLLAAALAGCAPAPRIGLRVPALELSATDGAAHAPRPKDGGARFTVLVFSAWHCPCQAVHDARLNELFARYSGKGVEFYAVDSEVGGALADDAAHAKSHGYEFPVLRDPGARLARALGAEYATESFVVDGEGVVRYHGGLDSDRYRLHDDAVPLLRNALDDLLDGRSPRAEETKSLGCSLQTF